ncbi:uncharacterized protein TNCV_2975451 [Trichonephila clavipes]|nr:uncharacterized protein TNCV_2975451 [Trichonephila clavipes]
MYAKSVAALYPPVGVVVRVGRCQLWCRPPYLTEAQNHEVHLHQPSCCFTRFRVKLNKSAKKAFPILTEAYGDKTLSRACVFEWHKRFSGERYSVEDVKRAGRPRPELGSDEWLLHQNNVPAPMVLSVKQFLTSKNITVMAHPPYSPDSAPCDFFLLSTVKSFLKGTYLTSVEEVQTKTENLPNCLPKNLVPELLPAMAAPNAEVGEC